MSHIQFQHNSDARTPPGTDGESRTVEAEGTGDSARSQRDSADRKESFAEVALRFGGASADEARRTGVVDTADDQVEDLFAPQYKTIQQSRASRRLGQQRRSHGAVPVCDGYAVGRCGSRRPAIAQRRATASRSGDLDQ